MRKDGSEPFMDWAASGLLKVTSGPRKGKITSVWGLNDSESFVQVSIDIVFKEGTRRSHFDLSKDLDVSIIDKCYSLVEEPHQCIQEMREMAPRLHLAVSQKERIFVRKSAHALNRLRSIVSADKDMSIDDMLEELIENHGIDSGNGNFAFPYDVVYGAGTVVADIYRMDNSMRLGSWFEVPASNCSFHMQEQGINIDSTCIEKNASKVTAIS